MTQRRRGEPLSDHPLFRALVLMGGGLAVGCGGVAQSGTPAGVELGSSGSPSGGSPSASAGSPNGVGGAISSGVPSAGAGMQASAGTAGADAAAFYHPDCPYEQWDCSAISPGSVCNFILKSKDDPIAAGCTCDRSRPTSVSACQANENFVCREAYPPYVEAQPSPNAWDGMLHVQCACVPSPPPSSNTCNALCSQTFTSAEQWIRCYLHNEFTCDENGVCTATAADVLRQDGIMCGCADIGLK